MSIASFSLSEPAIAQTTVPTSGKKPPPKRTVTPLRDTTAAPEPR